MTIELRTSLGTVALDGSSSPNGKLRGLVTPFNVWTTIGDPSRGGFNERVAAGSFAKTLRERDVVMLWNHNADMPLARTSAGNLGLHEAGDGLRAEADPVDTSYGRDAWLKRAIAEIKKNDAARDEYLRAYYGV